jgi:hypothetical protein
MPIPHDTEMYKWGHLIENCFQRLKGCRRVGTRYEKTDAGFAAVILVAATQQRGSATGSILCDGRRAPRAASRRRRRNPCAWAS